MAAILTTGRRTVANLLRTVAGLTEGDPSSYHRVLSLAQWSGLTLASLLARFILRHFWPQGRIRLVGDDTVTEHPGRKVYGKARHRDPVRSSHSYTAWRWGHKWVVLAVLVRFPFASRPWALPVLVALYRSPEDNQQTRPTPPDPRSIAAIAAAPAVALVPRPAVRLRRRSELRQPRDGHAGTPDPGAAARGQQVLPRRQPVRAAARLCRQRPAACQRRANCPRRRKSWPRRSARGLNVAWYGGGRRDVEVVTGTGHWYKAGEGLVAVRWVFVHDLTGTHRDEYFYSTDVTMTAQEIIEAYTGRWNIETTFEDSRAYLGLESTRGRCARTVRACRAVLVGVVQRGGVAVLAAAAGGAGAGSGGVGGQSHGDLLRCHHGREALAVDAVGFSKGRSWADLCKTPRSLPAVPALPLWRPPPERWVKIPTLQIAAKVKLREKPITGPGGALVAPAGAW